MDERHFKVGELAELAGLTVRTLHHWDEIGLLHPSERSGAGYRLYGGHDVERLYRILALRGLGLSLDEIRGTLDDGADLRAVVERQLAELDRRIALERRLRDRLVHLLEAPAGADLIDAIEVMTMIENYYTPEQLEALAERREQLGPEGMEQAQREWAELIEEVAAEQAAGTDPGDPRVQALADRWQALIERFTGGDPEIMGSLKRMYRDQGPEQASRGALKPEVADYIGAAFAARAG